MTINDIAELAGVSVSTVSKIINGKDGGIKAQTRERVLKIVKEYRYKPYDFIRKNKDSKNFLLGLVLSASRKHDSFQNGFLSAAEQHGYQVLVCRSVSGLHEKKHIAALCNNRADAILWEPFDEDYEDTLAFLKKSKIPFVLLNREDSNFALTYNYKQAGYEATQKLIESGHEKIYCFYNKDDKCERDICRGAELCLFDNHGLYTEYKDLYEALYVHGCSAVLCCGWDKALSVHEYALRYKFRIPHDVSIICVDDKENIKKFPAISTIQLSLHDFGSYACTYLIDIIEKRKDNPAPYTEEFSYSGDASIELSLPLRSKRIIVIGSINMDILLSVKEYPQIGKTVCSDNFTMIPGGKGINQAVGAARLGAKVSLIGNVGRDFDGNMILNVLHENGVDTSAMHMDTENPTGKAYIHVRGDGESGIVLYGGANLSVCADTVCRNENLFSDASFCLLQTEIPESAVKKAVEIAKKHNVKIMLKPSAVKKLDEKLLANLDFFIPNKKELRQLCPYGKSVEEKAAWFLEKGVKTVIVTMGGEGCYVVSGNFEQRFDAAPFVPVDTTGAADAFIAALAVYLLKRKSLQEALIYASWAAGFSTTKTGVVPSLIDEATLEYYIHKNDFN